MYVRDTGSGMNEATRNRIFEPYFTTKAEGQGTGLGLSIVHDIVAAHEGGMEVETTLGKGSTFTVFLPVSRIGTGSRRLANKGPLLMGNGQRILIVDDDPSVGLVTRMTLQRSAYEPEMFTSACEALKRFEMNPQSFDLVIVDQNMPETSGLDFVRRARLLVPKLPIIMMSGRFENAEAISALEVDLLKKPFEITNLIDAVRSALDRAGKRMAQS
jgi:CheY-like chemotaxis protein